MAVCCTTCTEQISDVNCTLEGIGQGRQAVGQPERRQWEEGEEHKTWIMSLIITTTCTQQQSAV
jgi:hypothetical protein